MTIEEAQREVRMTTLFGSRGQFVSGLLWVGSAAVATWGDRRLGFWVLFFGGFLIWPLTRVLLRMAGASALSASNPLRWLAMQLAFTVPATVPIAAGAAMFRPAWFYPACAMIVGAHYIPFIFLYGMWQFGVLAAVLLVGGLLLGMYGPPEQVTVGAWGTGAALFAFAAWAWVAARRGALQVRSPGTAGAEVGVRP